MRTSLSSIIFLVFVILAPVSAHAVTITFHDQIVVDGNDVTLGAIAKVLPAGDQARYLSGLTLASAPSPGEELRLQSKDLWDRLRRLEPQLHDVSYTGAEVITVSRAGVLISQNKVRKLLEQYLQSKKSRLPDAKIAFTKLQLPAPFVLPKGTVRTEIHPSDPDILHSRSFNLIFRVNDKPIKNVTVRGQIEATAPVATLAQDLPRGSILTSRDIIMVEKDIVSLRQPFLSPELLLGKKLKRRLRQGETFSATMVDSPPIIKRGEVVMIVLNKGALALSAKGVAKQDGEAGETIPVRNSNTQREILCRVIGPGQVTVGF